MWVNQVYSRREHLIGHEKNETTWMYITWISCRYESSKQQTLEKYKLFLQPRLHACLAIQPYYSSETGDSLQLTAKNNLIKLQYTYYSTVVQDMYCLVGQWNNRDTLCSLQTTTIYIPIKVPSTVGSYVKFTSCIMFRLYFSVEEKARTRGNLTSSWILC